MRALAIVLALGTAGPAMAAGNGAGAGGAGHQRAINSGLVNGEKGPPGSPNNPHRDATRDASAEPTKPAPIRR